MDFNYVEDTTEGYDFFYSSTTTSGNCSCNISENLSDYVPYQGANEDVNLSGAELFVSAISPTSLFLDWNGQHIWDFTSNGLIITFPSSQYGVVAITGQGAEGHSNLLAQNVTVSDNLSVADFLLVDDVKDKSDSGISVWDDVNMENNGILNVHNITVNNNVTIGEDLTTERIGSHAGEMTLGDTKMEIDSGISFAGNMNTTGTVVNENIISNTMVTDLSPGNTIVYLFPWMNDASVIKYNNSQAFTTSAMLYSQQSVRKTHNISDSAGSWIALFVNNQWKINYDGAGGGTTLVSGVYSHPGVGRHGSSKGTGTIGALYPLYSWGVVTAGATVTNFDSLHVSNPTILGAVTNLNGIHIEDLTQGSNIYGIRMYDRLIVNKDNAPIGLGGAVFGDTQLKWDGTNFILNHTRTNVSALAYFTGNVSATGYLTRSPKNMSLDSYEELKEPSEILDEEGKISPTSLLYGESVIGYVNNESDCWNETYSVRHCWTTYNISTGDSINRYCSENQSEMPKEKNPVIDSYRNTLEDYGIKVEITAENLMQKTCSKMPINQTAVDRVDANNRVMIAIQKEKIEKQNLTIQLMNATIQALESRISILEGKIK